LKFDSLLLPVFPFGRQINPIIPPLNFMNHPDEASKRAHAAAVLDKLIENGWISMWATIVTASKKTATRDSMRGI
jgi:hypothetical protein